MGFSIAWLAVETAEHNALFADAKVRPTQDEDEWFEGPVSGVPLDTGWFLLVAQGCGHRLIDRELLLSLSARWPCVACAVEEHVMHSSASLWRDGSEVWSASHNGDQLVFDLTTSGTLPDSFQELRDRIWAKQESEGGERADVDHIFEIPLLLAKELTGFKHDGDREALVGIPVAFDDEDPRAGRQPWWKLW